MNVKLIPLSYAPIWVAENAFQMNEDEINYIKNLSDYKLEGNNYLSHSSYVLNDTQMDRVKKLITEHTDKYISEILGLNDKFKLINSWTTRNPQDSVHHQHSHPNSIISGVYYVNAHSGDFILQSVPLFSKHFNFNYDIKDFNFVNKSVAIPLVLVNPSFPIPMLAYVI